MKMRQRRDLVHWGWIDVGMRGKSLKKFHTRVSAMRFAEVMNRMQFTDEEWEERQARLAWLKKWSEDLADKKGTNNVRRT